MKRKFILFLLALVMIFTLVSCPKEPEPIIPPTNQENTENPGNNETPGGGQENPDDDKKPGNNENSDNSTPENTEPQKNPIKQLVEGFYMYDREENPSYSTSTQALDAIFNPDELGQMVLVFDRSEWNKHLEYCYEDIQHEESVVARGFYFKKDNKEWFFNDIGFRIRGNTSRISPQEVWYDKESGTLKYGEYQQAHFALDFEEWLEDDEDKKLADSMKGLILKRFKEDSTYSREIYSYNFFRNNGIWLAPRASYTTLKIQIVDDMDLDGDGDKTEFETIDYGVYGMIEEIKKQFLKERTTKQGGGDLVSQKGNLWKCTYLSNFLFDEAADRIGEEDVHFVRDAQGKIEELSRVTYPYDYKGDNELAEGEVQLLNFMTELNNLPDCTDGINDDADIAKIKDFYTNKMDGDLFLRTYAISVILGMWDDYWVNMNNYYFYFDTDGKAYFIPYDYDNTLGTNGCEKNGTEDSPLEWGNLTDGKRPLIQKILQVPEYYNKYKEYLIKYSDENSLFDDDKSIAQISKWQNMIKPYVYSMDLKYDDTTPIFEDAKKTYPYTIYTPGKLNFFTYRQKVIKNSVSPSNEEKTLTINAGNGWLEDSNGTKEHTFVYKFTPGKTVYEITKDLWIYSEYSDEIENAYSYQADGTYYKAVGLIDNNGNKFGFRDLEDKTLWDDVTYEVCYTPYVPIVFNLNGGSLNGSTDLVIKYLVAGEDFNPEIWPGKGECYFINWTKTKNGGDYIKVVPNNTITVFAEWGNLSDIYEILIDGDIIGDFDGAGVPLKYIGNGVYTYTFTYDYATMNAWNGWDNYPALDSAGYGIIEFKIRPNRAWDGTQIGIGNNQPSFYVGGSSVYSCKGGGNIVVFGLQQGYTYTIRYTVNDPSGGFVSIDCIASPNPSPEKTEYEYLVGGYITGDIAYKELEYHGTGYYRCTFTYDHNDWSSENGEIRFNLVSLNGTCIGFVNSDEIISPNGWATCNNSGNPIAISGLTNGNSYTISYQITGDYGEGEVGITCNGPDYEWLYEYFKADYIVCGNLENDTIFDEKISYENGVYSYQFDYDSSQYTSNEILFLLYGLYDEDENLIGIQDSDCTINPNDSFVCSIGENPFIASGFEDGHSYMICYEIIDINSCRIYIYEL